MYEANVDDVGYRLVAIYTPVREDGIEGQPVSASTEPIAVGNSWLCLNIINYIGFFFFYCFFTSNSWPGSFFFFGGNIDDALGKR